MKRRDFLSGLLALPFMAAFASKMGFARKSGFASGGILPTGSIPVGSYRCEFPHIHRGNVSQFNANVLGNPFTISVWLKAPDGIWNRCQWHMPASFKGGPIASRILGYKIEDIGHPLLLRPRNMVRMTELEGDTTHDILAVVSSVIISKATNVECEIELLARDGVYIYEPGPPFNRHTVNISYLGGYSANVKMDEHIKRALARQLSLKATIKGHNRNV